MLPVDRALSHFFYWKKDYDPEKSGALRRHMIEEDWSIERFCLGEELRNLYDQFLWGFAIEKFDFIGITEFFEDDLAYFAQHYLNVAVDATRLNVGTWSDSSDIDPSLRKRIELFHDRDMVLYKKALELCLVRRPHSGRFSQADRDSG